MSDETPGRVDDCLFCQIVAGEIPATVLRADDKVVAFADIAPVAPTHVLIVPRRHIRDAAALTADDGDVVGSLVATAGSLAVETGIAGSGYRLVFNVGDDGGNTVSHLHLHLIGGRAMAWPPG